MRVPPQLDGVSSAKNKCRPQQWLPAIAAMQAGELGRGKAGRQRSAGGQSERRHCRWASLQTEGQLQCRICA